MVPHQAICAHGYSRMVPHQAICACGYSKMVLHQAICAFGYCRLVPRQAICACGYSRMVLCQSDTCYEKTYGWTVTAGLVGDGGCAPCYLLLWGHLKSLMYKAKAVCIYSSCSMWNCTEQVRDLRGCARIWCSVIQIKTGGQTMKELHIAGSIKNGTDLHK